MEDTYNAFQHYNKVIRWSDVRSMLIAYTSLVDRVSHEIIVLPSHAVFLCA